MIANSESEVLVLRAQDLDRLRKRFPRTALKLFHNLSAILSERLRSMTEMATSEAKEK